MVKLHFRLYFVPGKSIGPGKMTLLAAVDEEGSLSAAARKLGMSYRRAWLLLDSLNAGFDTPVSISTTGGRGGGGVVLTPFGRRLLQQYHEFADELAELTRRRWGRFGARHITPTEPPAG